MEAKLDAVLATVTSLKSEVEQRFAALEIHVQNTEKHCEGSVPDNDHDSRDMTTLVTPARDSATGNAVQPRSSSALLGGSGFGSVETEPLQARFQSVKDSLTSIHLPDNLVFSGWLQGIDPKAKETAQVLGSMARYVETALKLTGTLQDSDISEAQQAMLDDLTVTLVACMRHLQEKQAGLVVAGTYRPKAKKVFDSLSSTNSNFGHPQILGHVEKAAKLASLAREESSSSSQPQRPFHSFNNRGFGRPWRGWGGRGFRGNFHQGSLRGDSNPGFQPMAVPTDREDA